MARWSQAELCNYENRRASSRAIAQPIIRHEPLGAARRKVKNATRISVSVISYRRRLCDCDNLCPKYFIDCLRYAEIIKDDSPEHIELRVSQTKVKTSADERTEIIIL